MKKCLSILLVLAVILSLSITGIAADETGSITITNATTRATYTVYKLFDASYDPVAKSISYSITNADGVDPTTDFYDVLFDAKGDPTADNKYFVYNKNTGAVRKADDVADAELINYLTGIINATNAKFVPVASKTATDKTVEFTDLPHGYYFVISTLGTTVTITSNAPDVEVIDKNQLPGNGFQKKIWDDKLEKWADSNTAAIGDLVQYQVSFYATNYYGSEQVKYYTIHDTKGSALWVEFGNETEHDYDISVTVNDEKLVRGYYLPVGAIAPSDSAKWEWEYLGDWSAIPEAERDRNDAQWYLVHYGYDEFQIVIPWMDNHEVTGSQDTVYGWKFASDATSPHPSSSEVVVEYWASVEPNADIGGGSGTNLFNTASVRWTCANDSGSTAPDTVYTEVFGMGILKVDAVTNVPLKGAEFSLYWDEACTKPLYVIPTTIAGVYIMDDMNAEGQIITGENKKTAREEYADCRDASWGVNEQRNTVVSPVNGKIVVKGLDKGTYYMKETKEPSGYNALTATIKIEVGTGTEAFYLYADANGNVANLQAPDADYSEITYKVTKTTVQNSQGKVLPSTGGEGTFWMITIGTLLTIGFAVFLITNKKMSVYTD
jgi:LPXTG-motif cell wall-anchored protein